MPKTIKEDSGVYLLEIYAKKSFTLDIKKFADAIFPVGYYYYSGSAQKNLQHRVNRHKSKNKKLFWHIDYLTTNKNIIIKNVLFLPGKEKEYECVLINSILKKFEAKYIVKGFGNSDCYTCPAHLLYSKTTIFSRLQENYNSLITSE